jgi:hypothetical protein
MSSRPDEGDFFSNLPNPSRCTMALGLTQPLTEMSIRNLKLPPPPPEGKKEERKEKKNLGVKCDRRIGLTTLLPSISRLSK